MRAFLCLIAALICISAAPAQDHPSPTATSQSAAILPGMGHHHHPISTSSPEAQRFFDQGLTLDYAFMHDEAARSFQKAADLDPKAAMPYWGLALVLGPNYNVDVDPDHEKAAHFAIEKAKGLMASANESEKAYINALAQRYTNDPKPDFKKLAQNYANAMKEVSKRYPDDLDAATLYAEALMDLRPWQLWTVDGKPVEDTEEIVAVLESVLQRDPEHIGANHYYIHAMEASPHPERALPSAKRLETLVPGAGHLVHMPGHIYYRTGDYSLSAASNEAAVAADMAYVKETNDQGMYPLMYTSHNYHFLTYSRMQEGRFEDAKKAADEMVSNVAPHANMMPEFMAGQFLATPGFVLLRFNRWSEILALPQPDPKNAALAALSHFARGSAFAATGDLKSAESERQALTRAVNAIPADAPFGYNMAKDIAGTLAGGILNARIAEASGNRKAAIDSLRKAVEMQDRMSYDEPPDWFYPVRESLGGALLRDGQAAEAEQVFREDLQRNPRNGRSLFGLWQSLVAQKKMADADWARREFMVAWKSADTQLRIEDL
ncbi:MAG: tetratricopeptide repeat protein [Candidatus Acidiferrales bacterium]